VARDLAALAEALRDGPAARVADARDLERHLLCRAGRLPVAPAAERLAAMGDDLPLVCRLARWRALWTHELRARDGRSWTGRARSPSAAIIDSQSVKTTEAGGPRGYDAGKKVNGRKRHALVDTDGRGLVIEPHPASIQDRDGGGPLLQASRRIFPFIQRVFADSGYAGEKVAKATLIAVEIVRKNPGQVGFAVNPRRWVVERFFAWIGRNRRLAKDFEATIGSARAFLYAASVMLLVRRIANASWLSKATLIPKQFVRNASEAAAPRTRGRRRAWRLR
jgi:transposase